MARYTLKSPEEVLRELGRRVRALRLHRNLSQTALCERADVALRTLQRFENTGRASLEVAVRTAFALGVEQQLELLFQAPEPSTMDDLLAKRKPGRRRVRGSK